MIRRLLLLPAFMASFSPALFCQEVVTGLPSNPVLKNNLFTAIKAGMADTLSLPFFDDFSGSSSLPDPRKWSDANVFINNTYSERQITKGIATFDALDSRGQLYEAASATGFEADHLTSKSINLNYQANENIRLSFLYEPGGLSDYPDGQDSLTLQFYAPAENKWYSVWRMNGNEKKGFRSVILPVTNSRYLRKGFRFRFTNYSSLGQNALDPSMLGNCDIWNIDYVILDRNRSAADTICRDVAFTLPVRSMLKNHEAIPWKQFRQIYLQEMGAFIPVCYRNNDTITRNITRDFEIRDVYRNTLSHSFSSGATNINPLTSTRYNANLVYTFNSPLPDSAVFKVTCRLKTDEFDRKENDTLVYYQVFGNYFAFDDGSSEGGYGINGLGSRNAMVACRFTSFIPDTLRAVDICFNDSYLDANRRVFDIMIWDDDNGTPGNVIFTGENVIAGQGTRINGINRYYIPGGVNVNGVFHVGWKQRSETFLNAGYDVNTPNKGRMMYWINGSWSVSQVTGSVMIRPVTGNRLTTGSGIKITDSPHSALSGVTIWPNPAGDYIKIKAGDITYYASAYVSVINLLGKEVLHVPLKDEIDTSSLPDGIYFVITTIDGERAGFNRLIINR